MMLITEEIKQRVENCLKQNEGVSSFDWITDECIGYDENHKAIDAYLIDVNEEGVFYTCLSNWSPSIKIE